MAEPRFPPWDKDALMVLICISNLPILMFGFVT